VNLQEKSDTEG